MEPLHDLDRILQRRHDADPALQRVALDRRVAAALEQERLGRRGTDDLDAVEEQVVDGEVQPQPVCDFAARAGDR